MTVRTLSRRLIVGGTSAALVLGATVVGALAAGPTPTAGCVTLADPKGDAEAVPNSGYQEPTLDLTGLVMGADATTLRAVIRVDALASAPDTAVGETFYVYWTYNKHPMYVASSRYDPDELGAPQDEAAAETAGTPIARVPRVRFYSDGAYVPSSLKVAYDLKASTVTFEIPRAEVAKAGGGAFADGEGVTALYARDATTLAPMAGGLYVDSTTADNATGVGPKDVWTIGDNRCFGAAPGPAPTGTATPAPSGSATPAPSSSPSATPSATPSASPPAATTDADGLYLQPRKGCVNFADAAGDADPSGIGEFNEGSLDVTAVNLKSPTGALQVIVKLANASEALWDWWDGRIYDVSFTVAGKAVVLEATVDGPATATVAGKASADIKATAKTDTKASSIVFTVPLAGLSKAVGASVVPGTAITATAVETSAESMFGPFTADEAAGTKPAEKTYTYGDNACFLPPAGILALEADPSGQYTDVTVAYATLTDVDEAPVQGATVMGVLTGGKTAFGVTDEDGVAEIRLPIAVPAGAKTLKVAYAGNADIGAVTVTRPFTVKAEKVLLKAVATKGGVTATLTDDDRRVVAGQTVVFTIGTKKYAVKTSSRGIAALSRLKRGTVIKVSYAGSKNLFLATPTYTVKVR